MKRRSIRLSCLLLVVLVMASSLFCFSIGAAEETKLPAVENAAAACLYDKTHNKMLVNENPDTVLNTSTSAKVMTGLIACQMLAERLDETITVTAEMLQGTSGYSMRLSVGESIKIKDLLYGAICGSYNDAAYVLASVCAGSAQSFVSLMNERARELGAESTAYTNPLGYPDNSAMVTTLSDTLKIALAASDNELYMEISTAKKHDVAATNSSGARTVYNRNYLISSRSTQAYYNEKCAGMNAGISGDAGGWSIVTLAHDDGADYICIVLGGKENEDGSAIYAYDTVNKLVNWACSTYNNRAVFEKDQILGVAEIEMTSLGKEKVRVAAAESLSAYVSADNASNLEYRLEYPDGALRAPLKAGDVIGKVKIYSGNEVVGECDVYITEDCEVNAVMQVINTIGDYTKSRAFLATIVCFAILLPIVLVSQSRKNSRRKGYRKY